MYIHEYGNPNDPKILCLHPMGITGENLYQILIPHLKGKYCVIAPDQGGHGKSGPYHSFQDEMDLLKNYLKEKKYTQFRLLYGASMGVTVAYELVKDPALHFDKIWFDGGSFAEKPSCSKGVITWAMRIVLRGYRRNPKRIIKSFEKHYGLPFSEVMGENFLNLSDEDIIQIFHTFSCCKMKEIPRKIQETIHLEWGSRDMNYRRSRKTIQKYLLNAQVILREGYGHCGYMALHCIQYIQELEDFMKK